MGFPSGLRLRVPQESLVVECANSAPDRSFLLAGALAAGSRQQVPVVRPEATHELLLRSRTLYMTRVGPGTEPLADRLRSRSQFAALRISLRGTERNWACSLANAASGARQTRSPAFPAPV
jgi:hypothetical protein